MPALSSISDFLFTMHNKKFVKVMRDFLDNKEVDELEVGKMLSSYITHALIEAQLSEDPIHVLVVLKVKQISHLLNSLFDYTISVYDCKISLQTFLEGNI